MARLDRSIQVMHKQRADILQLAVGQPAALVTNGAARAMAGQHPERRADRRPVREVATRGPFQPSGAPGRR